MTQPALKYTRLSPLAFCLRRATEHSIGIDLKAPRDLIVPANDWLLVRTDLSIQLPHRCYGRIAPRSGLVATDGITVDAGVIDRDYTGNLGVVVVNRSKRSYQIQAGDRIAQLICERALKPVIQEVWSIPEQDPTNSCGSKGIGFLW